MSQLTIPSSSAHLEDLKDRLMGAWACTSACNKVQERAVVTTLVDVVRAMDRGDIGRAEAARIFAHYTIPVFSFDRWIEEMVDEGVYFAAVLKRAA